MCYVGRKARYSREYLALPELVVTRRHGPVCVVDRGQSVAAAAAVG